MTMLDPQVAARRERARNRATRLLTLVLGVFALFCGFLFINMVNPPPKQILVGNVSDFVVGETRTRAVPKLNISTTLQNRPDVSEDILYITRFADDTWRAVLAWDGFSGCIVQPDADSMQFRDPCSDRVYDAQGAIIDAQENLRLAVLPVVITQDDQVQVLDEFMK